MPLVYNANTPTPARSLVLALAFATGSLANFSGCGVRPNPAALCWNTNGDATCDERTMGAELFCAGGLSAQCIEFSVNGDYGCVAERPDDACYSPCGGGALLAEDASCIEIGGDGDGDPNGDGDGEPNGDGDGDLTGDGDADPGCAVECAELDAPYCDPNSGTCVPCGLAPDRGGDAACASLSADMPVCVEDQCVQCDSVNNSACMGITSICAPGTNTCVECHDQDQCPDSACNLDTGGCFDPSAVAHVDGNDPCDSDNSDGSETLPYCSIAAGLANASVIILHELSGEGASYSENIQISTPTSILASGGEKPFIKSNGGPAFKVNNSGSLFARGITASREHGVVVRVVGSAWFERCQIQNTDGRGMVVEGGGSLNLRNSFVGGTSSETDAVVLDVEAGGTFDITYSTIGTSPTDENTAAGVRCVDGSNSSLRNSIVLAFGDGVAVDCPELTYANNSTEDNLPPADPDDPDDPAVNWFADYQAGDFHLSGNYPEVINTTAAWQPGDPLTDIDGDPRPTTPGAIDVAGADIP